MAPGGLRDRLAQGFAIGHTKSQVPSPSQLLLIPSLLLSPVETPILAGSKSNPVPEH